MSRDWKPGDVAVVTEYGDAIPAYLSNGCSEHDRDPHWHYLRATKEGCTWTSAVDIAARPLVVIDAEDREQVERLAAGYERDSDPGETAIDQMQAALHEFANPSPPKPDEPTGLGAVVEDAGGLKWVRTHDTLAPWARHNFTGSRYWSGLDVVRVLSYGVSSDE